MHQVLFIILFLFLCTPLKVQAAVSEPSTPEALPYDVLASEKEKIGGLLFRDYAISLRCSIDDYDLMTDNQLCDSMIAAAWELFLRDGANCTTVRVYPNKYYLQHSKNIAVVRLRTGSEYLEEGWSWDVDFIPTRDAIQLYSVWYSLRPDYIVQECYGLELDYDGLLNAVASRLAVPKELISPPEERVAECGEL